jgi:hypothetical protein
VIGLYVVGSTVAWRYENHLWSPFNLESKTLAALVVVAGGWRGYGGTTDVSKINDLLICNRRNRIRVPSTPPVISNVCPTLRASARDIFYRLSNVPLMFVSDAPSIDDAQLRMSTRGVGHLLQSRFPLADQWRRAVGRRLADAPNRISDLLGYQRPGCQSWPESCADETVVTFTTHVYTFIG